MSGAQNQEVESLLRGTELASATFETVRLRLLKVAARVQTGRTFVRFHMPANCPVAGLFQRVSDMARALNST